MWTFIGIIVLILMFLGSVSRTNDGVKVRNKLKYGTAIKIKKGMYRNLDAVVLELLYPFLNIENMPYGIRVKLNDGNVIDININDLEW